MINEIKSIKESNIIDKIFFLGLSFLTASLFLSFDNIEKIKVYLGIISILLFFCKILFSFYTKKDLFFGLVLLIIILASTYYSGRQALLMSFFVLYSSKNIPIRKIFFVIFWIGLVSMLISISFYLITQGFTMSVLENRQFLGMNISVSKNGLGYSHANMLYLLSFVLMSIYSYFRFDFFNLKDAAFISVLSMIVFLITFSRTGIILSFLSILVLYALKILPYDSKIFKIIPYIPLCIIILSFLLPYLYYYYSDGVMYILNRTLSDRIYYSGEFLRVAQPSLFGVDVNGLLGGETQFPLRADNSFVLIIRAYGYINFLILCLLTFRLSKQRYKKEEWYIIIMMYVYCFTEAFFVIAVQNIALFIITKEYFAYNKEEVSIKNIIWRLFSGSKNKDI